MKQSLLKLTIAAVLWLNGVNTYAQEIYMAIVSTSTKYSTLITLYNKKCEKPDGNVVLLSGKELVAGCWALDGAYYKIEWFDGAEPNFYNRLNFRLIGNMDVNKR